jgi:hypothetical protein
MQKPFLMPAATGQENNGNLIRTLMNFFNWNKQENQRDAPGTQIDE